jgi:hypothetical protein
VLIQQLLVVESRTLYNTRSVREEKSASRQSNKASRQDVSRSDDIQPIRAKIQSANCVYREESTFTTSKYVASEAMLHILLPVAK